MGTMMRVMGTKRNYLAFDIETAKVVEDEPDWRSCRPLGMSCAATLGGDDGLVLWHGGSDRSCPADRISREEAVELVRYLEDRVAHGYTLLTWNGLGFDLDVLAEEAQMLPNAAALPSPTWT